MKKCKTSLGHLHMYYKVSWVIPGKSESRMEHCTSLIASGVTGGVGGGGRGRVPSSRDFSPGNFCGLTGKRGKEKRENGAIKEEIQKGKVENRKWKEEKLQNEERTFFFCFVFVLFCFVLFFVLNCFCFVLFCFVLVCVGFFFFFFFFFFGFHFSKSLKFVLSLPKWEFSTGKKHFTPGKNQQKWLAPSEKYSSYAPANSC